MNWNIFFFFNKSYMSIQFYIKQGKIRSFSKKKYIIYIDGNINNITFVGTTQKIIMRNTERQNILFNSISFLTNNNYC